MKRRLCFHHYYTNIYGAMDVYWRAASIAYRASRVKIHGTVSVRWLVNPRGNSISGSTYRGVRGRDSGTIVMRISPDVRVKGSIRATALNLANIVGTFAHELRHVHDNQHHIRRVRKPTSDEHGTPSERIAALETEHVLQMLTINPHRRRFDQLTRRLHKNGIRRISRVAIASN